MDWEFRPVQVDDYRYVRRVMDAYVEEELLPQMRTFCPEADISTETMGEITGLQPMDSNTARDLVSGLLGANGADVVSFGTEAGLFQNNGIDVVVCGPGSIRQAHKPDEYVAVDQLDACLRMLDRLGERLI